MFRPIIFDCKQPYNDIHRLYSEGFKNPIDYQFELLKYGKCQIDVPMKSLPRLLIEEVLNPFYVFQVNSC